MPLVIFFTDGKQGKNKKKNYKQARTLCLNCVVADECLVDAVRTKEEYGLRGGLTEGQRRNMARKSTADIIRIGRSIREKFAESL